MLMLAVPALALLTNYMINMCLYYPMWNTLDPEKPKYDDKLNEEEVRAINDCDEWFDKWNERYPEDGDRVKCCMVFFSHKLFHLPFTHFLGCARCTVKT